MAPSCPMVSADQSRSSPPPSSRGLPGGHLVLDDVAGAERDLGADPVDACDVHVSDEREALARDELAEQVDRSELDVDAPCR